MGNNSLRAAAAMAASLALALPGTGPEAAETAALPYGVVYRMLSTMQEAGELDKLVRSTRITSELAGVEPPEIRITLDDRGQVHEFRPDAQGNVAFPVRADWNDAGLVLQTNQPAGSLALSFGFTAKPLASTQLAWRDLMGIAHQFRVAIAASMRSSGKAAPDIAGLQVQFGPDAEAGLAILAAAGRQAHPADAEGIVWLPDDPALWSENPQVELTRVPVAIVPWVR